MEDVGKRQLKNRCLLYLMLLPEFVDLGKKQFDAALKSNMTDTQPALFGLTNADTPLRGQCLNEFYTTWKHDALVVDKWLAIQASTKLPTALQEVRKLMRHEAFDIRNPNKVYSLIGAFTRNSVNFHSRDGEGYAFLREVVQQLDKLNPQVAARMVKPLTTWSRYDKERQELMREQLELLQQDKKLSPDLYEMVSKSLSD
jgi:aminopeptidase N